MNIHKNNIYLVGKFFEMEELKNQNKILNIGSLINMKEDSGFSLDDYLIYITQKLDIYHANLITFTSIIKVCFWLFVLEKKEFILLKEESTGFCHLYPVGKEKQDYNFKRIELTEIFKRKGRRNLNLKYLKIFNSVRLKMISVESYLDKANDIENNIKKLLNEIAEKNDNF